MSILMSINLAQQRKAVKVKIKSQAQEIKRSNNERNVCRMSCRLSESYIALFMIWIYVLISHVGIAVLKVGVSHFIEELFIIRRKCCRIFAKFKGTRR